MLVDKKMFDKVESASLTQEKIKSFEKEVGKITGRMMITVGKVPENLNVNLSQDAIVFIGSFDFYDSTIGVAFNIKTKMPESGLWVTPQCDGAEKPSDDWIQFFIDKLLESINDDGSFGTPVYSFVNDTADMTIVPTE